MGDLITETMPKPIAFIDLAAQQRRIEKEVKQAINNVLAHGLYVSGPEVEKLEGQLAAHCGAKHAIGCSSGTDAIVLALMALGVGPGDAVFVPTFTFAATAEAVALVGATPVFVDCHAQTYNMDSRSLDEAISMIAADGELRPVGVIVVGMFGQPPDFKRIDPVAAKYRLWVIDDAAQSYGAAYDNRKVGALAKVTTTSFFPAKPLGCYGDGGAIFTDDDELADVIRSLLVHGKGADKYDNVRIGMNGRLDTIQAAILIEKMKIFDEEIDMRNEVYKRYNAGLKDIVEVPAVVDGGTSVWAQYTIALDGRDSVSAKLKSVGVPTAIYYPKPLHTQTAYRHFPSAPGGLPVSETLAQKVLSLPMHPYLDPATQERIIKAVITAIETK
ncbi:MAG: DegT/DnrJ/EryC1/StrS aminotransferase family protein [Pseudolabrys sp.]|nr:DegT/DnrJ/EryC1/StrS aminotransferase family protein [Pseudolabrys sp.]